MGNAVTPNPRAPLPPPKRIMFKLKTALLASVAFVGFVSARCKSSNPSGYEYILQLWTGKDCTGGEALIHGANRGCNCNSDITFTVKSLVWTSGQKIIFYEVCRSLPASISMICSLVTTL
ncbi:hypothetical protein BV22DRAFT_318121 [Leucogyrophana mollusca]|uniref:Uncharacterized protein n=1 Tax=Leucogyrophana mollusca TaxID=85980 RepID=A0ACB8BMN2_9AGAM|nr:hypothetical protein BV22DRAFT_318121 [Leucogyrophana mollusca]